MTGAVVLVFAGKVTVNGAALVEYVPPKFNTATERLAFDALYTNAPAVVIVELDHV